MAAFSIRQRKKITEKKLELRKRLWPDVDEKALWHRKATDGWLSIPGTMPIIMQIMNDLSKNKPPSATYLERVAEPHPPRAYGAQHPSPCMGRGGPKVLGRVLK
jgi:hypothetical protein